MAYQRRQPGDEPGPGADPPATHTCAARAIIVMSIRTGPHMNLMIRCLGALAVSVTMLAQAAFAHTGLSRSVPEKGSTVASPAALTLAFEDAVRLARVQIISPTGEALSLPLERGAMPAKTLVVVVPQALAKGAHTVTWRAIAGDGHVMTGDFSFTVR